ncbi:class I SAM-dependent methyltransferase [Streptococcus macacae]|uniref:N-6 DNA Methylase n=1 Tax=Streptococcus macacae NCTC 11558 TaxID=764298 RepID=G5JWB4_9STRE|nr:class I SAM-dependent methyltransferase [Streptococcus macacae]EHJ52436.1 N-6 DNA Methylase [Streptococcus macacae NCTC 11558]SUN77769.1 adenine-specific DNA-methyltransferase [Streptococcus macacae NCTC 11558]
MNFENIETAYNLILENCQRLEIQLQTTNLYEALIEQNVCFINSEDITDKKIKENNEKLRYLNLSEEEWRRSFQFIFIKAMKDQFLQANHQFTPDSIAFILLYLLEELTHSPQLDILEIGSGTGNLAETLVINSQKTLDYMGIEVDDLLIDLAASIADVIGTDISFVQEDAIRPQILKESDVIISDLPIGYYPNDNIAKRYQVASLSEHTYAHHLLMEQSLKYLKKDGIALFLAPNNLLTSPQSDLLKKWLKDYANLIAVITLPENLFENKAYAKTIFILKKHIDNIPETFVYPLSDLQAHENITAFMESFKKWKLDNSI